MDRKVIEIEELGNMRMRADGKLHLYFMTKGANDITHEIVLSKKATAAFKEKIDWSKRFDPFGFADKNPSI